MSCTIIAVPLAIHWIGAFIGVGTIALAVNNSSMLSEDIESKIEDYETKNICEDKHIISETEILEKSFETPFANKDILIKTLEEHGVKNINEDYGKITGIIDKYALTFEKKEEDKPYNITINYHSSNNPEETLNDLNSEYALNVQEESYLSIIEKLKNNNMEIEEEEVLDDNTIVLTVNLEN